MNLIFPAFRKDEYDAVLLVSVSEIRATFDLDDLKLRSWTTQRKVITYSLRIWKGKVEPVILNGYQAETEARAIHHLDVAAIENEGR